MWNFNRCKNNCINSAVILTKSYFFGMKCIQHEGSDVFYPLSNIRQAITVLECFFFFHWNYFFFNLSRIVLLKLQCVKFWNKIFFCILRERPYNIIRKKTLIKLNFFGIFGVLFFYCSVYQYSFRRKQKTYSGADKSEEEFVCMIVKPGEFMSNHPYSVGIKF